MFDEEGAPRVVDEPRLIRLSEEGFPTRLPNEFLAPKEELGADEWQKMVDMTQKTRLEHGIHVVEKNGVLRQSRIFAGRSHSLGGPPASELLRQLMKREKPFGTINTHFYDTTVDTKVPTSTFSTGDIAGFKDDQRSKFKGMIDIGGAHVLIRISPTIFNQHKELPSGNISIETIQQVGKNGGTILDVMKQLAGLLEQHGISYYFTPNLTPNPDGTVQLQNVLSIESLKPRETTP